MSPVVWYNPHLWLHRGFMVYHTLRSRWHVCGNRRIILKVGPRMEHPIRQGLRHTRHTLVFGEIPPGGNDFDLALPLTLEATKQAATDAVLCRRNPLPIPALSVIELCDDKARLNDFLRAQGFARHIATPAATGVYPYILKRRHDSASHHVYRIEGPVDEETHAEALASGEYLRQVWIDGNTEYAAHILFIDGKIRHMETTRYVFAGEHPIHGQSPLLSRRRCRSRYADLFTQILRRIGYEGLCCIDYRSHQGVPMIWEVNPRLGFNATPFLVPFIRALDWERSTRVEPTR